MARTNLYRKIDFNRPFFAIRRIKSAGRTINPGDLFDIGTLMVSRRRAVQLYENRLIGHEEDLLGLKDAVLASVEPVAVKPVEQIVIDSSLTPVDTEANPDGANQEALPDSVEETMPDPGNTEQPIDEAPADPLELIPPDAQNLEFLDDLEEFDEAPAAFGAP